MTSPTSAEGDEATLRFGRRAAMRFVLPTATKQAAEGGLVGSTVQRAERFASGLTQSEPHRRSNGSVGGDGWSADDAHRAPADWWTGDALAARQDGRSSEPEGAAPAPRVLQRAVRMVADPQTRSPGALASEVGTTSELDVERMPDVAAVTALPERIHAAVDRGQGGGAEPGPPPMTPELRRLLANAPGALADEPDGPPPPPSPVRDDARPEERRAPRSRGTGAERAAARTAQSTGVATEKNREIGRYAWRGAPRSARFQTVVRSTAGARRAEGRAKGRNRSSALGTRRKGSRDIEEHVAEETQPATLRRASGRRLRRMVGTAHGVQTADAASASPRSRTGGMAHGGRHVSSRQPAEATPPTPPPPPSRNRGSEPDPAGGRASGRNRPGGRTRPGRRARHRAADSERDSDRDFRRFVGRDVDDHPDSGVLDSGDLDSDRDSSSSVSDDEEVSLADSAWMWEDRESNPKPPAGKRKRRRARTRRDGLDSERDSDRDFRRFVGRDVDSHYGSADALDSGDLDSGDLDSGDLDSGDLDSGDHSPLSSGDLDEDEEFSLADSAWMWEDWESLPKPPIGAAATVDHDLDSGDLDSERDSDRDFRRFVGRDVDSHHGSASALDSGDLDSGDLDSGDLDSDRHGPLSSEDEDEEFSLADSAWMWEDWESLPKPPIGSVAAAGHGLDSDLDSGDLDSERDSDRDFRRFVGRDVDDHPDRGHAFGSDLDSGDLDSDRHGPLSSEDEDEEFSLADSAWMWEDWESLPKPPIGSVAAAGHGLDSDLDSGDLDSERDSDRDFRRFVGRDVDSHHDSASALDSGDLDSDRHGPLSSEDEDEEFSLADSAWMWEDWESLPKPPIGSVAAAGHGLDSDLDSGDLDSERDSDRDFRRFVGRDVDSHHGSAHSLDSDDLDSGDLDSERDSDRDFRRFVGRDVDSHHHAYDDEDEDEDISLADSAWMWEDWESTPKPPVGAAATAASADPAGVGMASRGGLRTAIAPGAAGAFDLAGRFGEGRSALPSVATDMPGARGGGADSTRRLSALGMSDLLPTAAALIPRPAPLPRLVSTEAALDMPVPFVGGDVPVGDQTAGGIDSDLSQLPRALVVAPPRVSVRSDSQDRPITPAAAAVRTPRPASTTAGRSEEDTKFLATASAMLDLPANGGRSSTEILAALGGVLMQPDSNAVEVYRRGEDGVVRRDSAATTTKPDPRAAWPDRLDALVDVIVERIEEKVVDELERRGRRHERGVF